VPANRNSTAPAGFGPGAAPKPRSLSVQTRNPGGVVIKEDTMRFRLAPAAPLLTSLVGVALFTFGVPLAYGQNVASSGCCSRPACCPVPMCPCVPGQQGPQMPGAGQIPGVGETPRPETPRPETPTPGQTPTAGETSLASALGATGTTAGL